MPKIYGDLEFQGTARVVADNNGTALLPGITFSGDLNTGMYRHAADVLGFSTNGILRLLINDEGALVISDTTAPGTTTNKLYAVGGNLFWDGGQIPSGSSFLSNIVEDTTPQLGGDLDVNDFNIVGKPAATVTSAGGAVDIVAADGGATSGAGGALNLSGGDVTNGSATAGSVNINSGTPDTGSGGPINLTTSSGAYGGDIALTAGDGTSAITSGGNISITSGGHTTNGGGGTISIFAGSSVTGNPGTIKLRPGDGGTTGYISILGANASTAADLRIHESNSFGSQYIGFTVPDNGVTTSITYTLPEAPGANGYLLAATTAGVMSWTDPSSLGVSFPLLAPDGTAGAPSYSFSSDTDTGIYRTTTNSIGFSAGSNNVVTIDTTGLSMANGTVIFADEIASTPSYSFVNDPNTGMGANGLGDRLEFYSGGTKTLDIRPTHILPLVQTRNIDGTSGAPSYSFGSNQTTGIFKDGAAATDPIAFTVNSQESLNIESDGTLNVAAVTNYETLVIDDDDIPNKKYVDDAAGGGTAVQLTEFTASAGQTVFGGPDDNAVTLAYIPGQLYVYKNGVLLEDTTDYVATNGTAIVLNNAAALNDFIQATAFSTVTGVGASASDYIYTATAGQTTFTGNDDNGDPLSYTAGDLMVFLNGALLKDVTDYTATNGTSVVLTAAASAGNILQVYEWGSFLLSSDNQTLDQYVYTATAAQTVFTGADDNTNTLAYTAGFQKVYLNGALLEDTTDYTATNGTSITLISAASLNDVVQITAFGTFSVADHYTKSELSDASAGDIHIGVRKILTNAMATTQHDVNEERFINVVIDFGADRSGTTDASSDINDAIDSITKGTVYIPQGFFLLTSSIVPKNGVRIVCEGKGITTFLAGTNSMVMVDALISGSTKFHFGFSDATFTDNGKTGVIGLRYRGASSTIRLSNLVLENLYLSGLSGGIIIELCVNVDITKVHMAAVAQGYKQTDCADVDLSHIRVQNGSGIGFYIIGSNPATAYDEGFRGVNLSTNGQVVGIQAENQDFGNLTNCSFTTCSSGAGKFLSCTQWNLNNTEWAVAGGTPANIGLDIDNSCEQFTITGGNCLLNTFGLKLQGTRHTVTGMGFHGNSNVDLYLINATKSAIGTCQCDSTGAAWSILEAGTANQNNIGNNVTNGLIVTTGGSSVAHDNIQY